jgi:hypothetical protein
VRSAWFWLKLDMSRNSWPPGRGTSPCWAIELLRPPVRNCNVKLPNRPPSFGSGKSGAWRDFDDIPGVRAGASNWQGNEIRVEIRSLLRALLG